MSPLSCIRMEVMTYKRQPLHGTEIETIQCLNGNLKLLVTHIVKFVERNKTSVYKALRCSLPCPCVCMFSQPLFQCGDRRPLQSQMPRRGMEASRCFNDFDHVVGSGRQQCCGIPQTIWTKARRNHDETTTKPQRNHSHFTAKMTKPSF